MDKLDLVNENFGFVEFRIHSEFHGIFICIIPMLLKKIMKLKFATLPTIQGDILCAIANTKLVFLIKAPAERFGPITGIINCDPKWRTPMFATVCDSEC